MAEGNGLREPVIPIDLTIEEARRLLDLLNAEIGIGFRADNDSSNPLVRIRNKLKGD